MIMIMDIMVMLSDNSNFTAVSMAIRAQDTQGLETNQQIAMINDNRYHVGIKTHDNDNDNDTDDVIAIDNRNPC